MIKQALSIDIQNPFGNLLRERHVLIALINGKNEVILGNKPKYYPPGISRLIGGGVDKGEAYEQAAIRELQEETGILIDKSKLIPIRLFDVNATDIDGNKYHNQTAIFAVNIRDEKIKPADDIASVTTYNFVQLQNLIKKYQSFDKDLKFIDGDYEFYWEDYGKMYAPIHQAVYDYIS